MNVSYHNDRFNRTRHGLFGIKHDVDLFQEINSAGCSISGQARCRVIYGELIHEILFTEYIPKIINSLRLISDDEIDYSYKYLDRSRLDELFSRRGNSDDILIVKNGLITDASSSNVAFFDGNEWHTPLHPLLRGTCRARLLDENKIIEKNISPADLRRYRICSPFNALRGPGVINIPADRIYQI